MDTLRKPLLSLSVLVALTLACTTITRLFRTGEEPSTGAFPTAAPPGETAPAEEPAEAEPTEARRLELRPTPTPVGPVSEDDVRSFLDLSQPDYYDYFDDPATWFDYDTQGRAAYRFEDGQLVGIDYEPEELYTWWSYTDRQSGNLYTEISITNGDCVGKDSVGIAVRVDPDQAAGGYALEIACDGHWRFRRHRIGKQPIDMTEWTSAAVINTGAGATNRLGIWAYRTRFVLFVNGQQVGEVFDPNYSYSYGSFAVFVRASQTFDLTATFDDFALWHIPYLP
jgi:hypothetical protein